MSPGWRAAWQRLCWHHTGGGLRRLRSAWGRSARAISGGRLDAPRIRSGSRLPVGRGRGKGEGAGAGRIPPTANGEESPLQPLVTRAARPAASPRRHLGCCGRRRGKEPRWGRCWSGQPGRAGPGEHFGPAASWGPDGAAESPWPSLEGSDGEPFLGGRSQPAPWPRGSRPGGPRGQRLRAWVLLSGEAAGQARAWATSPSPPLLSLRGFLLLRGCPRTMRRLSCGSPERPLALAAFGTGRNSLWRCGKRAGFC